MRARRVPRRKKRIKTVASFWLRVGVLALDRVVAKYWCKMWVVISPQSSKEIACERRSNSGFDRLKISIGSYHFSP